MVAEGEDWNDVQVPGKKVVQSPVTKVDDVQTLKAEAKTTSEPVDRYS